MSDNIDEPGGYYVTEINEKKTNTMSSPICGI